MGEHLIDGEFQSDKYPTTPRGYVPIKPSDTMAQDLLWSYAQRRRKVDAEFADDLEEALRLKGYEKPRECINCVEPIPQDHIDDHDGAFLFLEAGGYMCKRCMNKRFGCPRSTLELMMEYMCETFDIRIMLDIIQRHPKVRQDMLQEWVREFRTRLGEVGNHPGQD